MLVVATVVMVVAVDNHRGDCGVGHDSCGSNDHDSDGVMVMIGLRFFRTSLIFCLINLVKILCINEIFI